jgi:NitT/TauT family transport system permease protein
MKKKSYSAEHQKYLNRRKRTSIIVAFVQVGLLLLFIGLWELLARLEVIDTFIMSSPSKIWETFLTLSKGGDIFKHMWTTLYETIVSFLLATVLGTLIAIILWFSSTVRRVFEPYLVVLNALPKIALGPIIIIWVGAGTNAIIAMALLISLIITIINTLTGFIAVDREKLLLMETLHANKLQTLFKLVLPANIPTIMGCLKINVGLAWVGTIMGEYLVSKAGLGYLIVYGGQVFNLSLVMCSTVLLCLLAAGMYAVVALIEKLVIKRFPV